MTNERNIANLWEGIILFCHSGQFLALRFRPHFALRFLAFVVQCLLGTLTGLDGPVLLHGSTCGTLWDPVGPCSTRILFIDIHRSHSTVQPGSAWFSHQSELRLHATAQLSRRLRSYLSMLHDVGRHKQQLYSLYSLY